MSAIRFACVTHEGKTHAANEDRWLGDPAHGLYLVSDGMANDIAPEEVIRRLPELFAEILQGRVDLSDDNLHRQIAETLDHLSREVREVMRRAGELGLGATLVLALIREGRALLAHLGDSRVYLFRNGALKAMTRDHSHAQELLARGVISADEAITIDFGTGPTRFLGMSAEAKADIQVLDLQDADRLLLCSDGLTAMLRDDEIGAVLAKHPTAQEACQALTDAANAAGGLDNITALVIDVVT